MKQFRKILCLLLAILFVLSALASCGSNETPDTTQPSGDNGNNNGGDTTTTLAPGPCEVHTFAAGSLCTDARTCTVCGTAVEAGTHVYAEGSLCTEARNCTACGAAAPVNAEHTAGAYATCGTDQTCIHCSYIFAERTNRHGYKDNFCTVCGQKRPMEISEFTIAGVPIKDFTIVIPNKDFYGAYVSSLITHRVSSWHGEKLVTVTDKNEEVEHEIRIGSTNRTVTEVGDWEYAIKVVDGDLEIVCGNMYAYEGLIDKVCEVITRSAGAIHLEADTCYTDSFTAKDTDAKDGDVRIMFHNMLNAVPEGKILNVSSRYSMFRMLYSYYQPDIIGMQEAANSFFSAENGIAIKTFLTGNKYKIVNDGKSQPIFYNTKTLELMDSNYLKATGGKGTSWAIFRTKETDKYFAIINLHFSANSAAPTVEECNQLRIFDAKTIAVAKSEIVAAAKKLNLSNAETLPIIAGGDYNCRVGDDPIAVVEQTLVNLRDMIEDKTKVDDLNPGNGYPSYNEDFNYHSPTYHSNFLWSV